MKHLYTSLFVILLTTLSLLPAQARADVDYFTITALEAGVTVKITYAGGSSYQTDKITVDFSKDNGVSWTTASDIKTWSTTLTNVGDKIIFKGNNSQGFNTTANKNASYNAFQFDKNVSLSGNIMSLIDKNAETLTVPDYCFFRAFRDQTKIIDISGLKLPAKELSVGCYQGLFDGCTGITGNTPDLSAIESVSESSCQEMFKKCKIVNIVGFPQLSAIGKNSFQSTFNTCTELVSAPELTATEVGIGSYAYMFSGCTKLKNVQTILPATTVYSNSYAYMFSGCTSLERAPELPATTLGTCCYDHMFNGCTALTTAPSELPAATAVSECYKFMFYNCSKLEVAPVIKATTWTTGTGTDKGCMAEMFYNCSKLNYLKVYFTTWDNNSSSSGSYQATYNWMKNTTQQSSRTFLSPCALISPTVPRGVNRVQTYWTAKCICIYTLDVATNGGTWDGTKNEARTIDRVSEEASLSSLHEAQKTGYRFTGWNTKADGSGDAITLDNQTNFTTDATFYAQFEKMPAYTFNVATTGGTWDGSDDADRVHYAELPSVTPQKEGNNFTGWNTESDGSGNAITADNISSFTADATFYAQWQPQLIELDDTQDNSELLASLNGVSCDVLLAGRTLVGGCANTLCLPFDLTKEQLAESPLSGCTIWEFGSSTFNGETLHIDAIVATEIEAGKPYLVEPAAAVQNLRFEGVTISASTGTELGNNAVRFVGILSPFTMTAGSEDQLFVGAGNKLLRPSSTSALRGFRAWFRLNDGPAQAAPRAKLTFGEKPQVPTGLDNTEKDSSPRKIFINGQLYITHDGATYTPAGNVMPK